MIPSATPNYRINFDTTSYSQTSVSKTQGWQGSDPLMRRSTPRVRKRLATVSEGRGIFLLGLKTIEWTEVAISEPQAHPCTCLAAGVSLHGPSGSGSGLGS